MEEILKKEISLGESSRIGLFGGSFNPAHEWHFQVAKHACKILKLDKIIWLVSPHNPLKDKKTLFLLEDRLESAKKIARSPNFIITDIEKKLKTQYSIDTISIFQETFLSKKFVWIMGSDNAAQIKQWKDWKLILKKIAIAIYPRATHPLDEVEKIFEKYSNKIDERNAEDLIKLDTPCFTFINGPMNDISSSEIRRRNS